MIYKEHREYKPSGIEWLGEIPEHWETVKVRYLCDLRTEKAEAISCSDLKIALENIESGSGRLIDRNGLFEGQGNLFIKGDVLFSKLRPYLRKAIIAPGDGTAVGELLVLRPFQMMLNRLLLYHVLSDEFISLVDGSTYGAKMPRASWDFICQVELPFPPSLAEQQAIADFLDLKTHQIDTLIEKKQGQIELLKEYRAAVINQAVTKGLDPDAPMKDSGIECLGKIPAHWAVQKITYLTELIVDGTHFSPQSDLTGDYLYITAKNIKESGVDLSNVTYVRSSDHHEIYRRCPVIKGDVLYIKDGATAGISTINQLNEPFSLLSSVALIRPKVAKYSSKYMVYHLNDKGFKHNVLNNLIGGAMTRFTIEIIKQFRLLAPPLSEQVAIADFLDEKTARIDELTSKLEESITLLREYRIALISATVTGKVDVRSWASEEKPKRIAPPEFKRAVLATEIVYQLHDHPTFGRIKHQKLLHLCIDHCELDLPFNPKRKAAGPLDTQMVHSVEGQMKRQKWFEAANEGGRIVYKKCQNAGGHREYFYRYFSDSEETINFILRTFKKAKTVKVEIVSTLYASWNDFLIAGHEPTDEQIIEDVLTKWNPAKKRISRERWAKALVWMREKGLVPKGKGHKTKPGNIEETS